MAPDLHLEAPEAKRKNLPVSYFSWICILYNYTLSLTVFYIVQKHQGIAARIVRR